jgi:hypothetical protein
MKLTTHKELAQKEKAFIEGATADKYEEVEIKKIEPGNEIQIKAEIRQMIRVEPVVYKAFRSFQSSERLSGKPARALSFQNIVNESLKIYLKKYMD